MSRTSGFYSSTRWGSAQKLRESPAYTGAPEARYDKPTLAASESSQCNHEVEPAMNGIPAKRCAYRKVPGSDCCAKHSH